MRHPGQHARRPAAVVVPAGAAAWLLCDRDEVPATLRLREPVILVSEAKGREVFCSSFALFRRLESLAVNGVSILQLREEDRILHERSIAALVTMLRACRWRNFERAARLRRGPERAKRSRWAWEYLGEYLGFEWERAG
ncbi:hypothetical protein OpiT1DRAFT_04778 [Opitutaceae bacterium TAV1]|nr:hypothetical protein OpiT1DRAFT_04778 [Opitutaceae bacterium TAV1]